MLLTLAALAGGAWMLTFTRSTTALTTPLIAAVVGTVVWLLGDRTSRHRNALFGAGVVVFLAGVGAVVAHGLYHGSLPGASLNFRWRYWVGSWALFQEHWVSGVGFGSFGPWYLAFRLPAAAEEIRDPHNLLMRFATELGVSGLVLCCLWLLVSAREATRPARPPVVKGLAVGPVGLAGVVGLAFLINIAVSIDFAAGSEWVLLEMFKRLMFAGVLLVVAALALVVSRSEARGEDAPAPLLLLAIGCGLLVFLIHNLIDFSFFETGPMAVAAMLVGASIGVRQSDPQPTAAGETEARGGWWVSGGLLAGGVAVAAAFAVVIARPIVQAESLARAADELLRTAVRTERDGGGIWPERAQQAALTYRAAYDTVPWNSEYAVKSARAWLVGRLSLPSIREMLDAAIRTDPVAVKPRLDRARLELQLPPNAGEVQTAVQLLKSATELNPNDVPIRLEYADALERAGRKTEAAAEIRIALRFDDLLDPTEPKRLSKEDRDALEARASALAGTG
jgi:hypothetical protein